MTPEPIPLRPTDPLLDLEAGRVAPRMLVNLHHLMTARRLGGLTVIFPVPRLHMAKAEARRAKWRPGAVVPLSEPWHYRWGHGVIYQADQPHEAPGPDRFWNSPSRMPRRAVRLALLILGYERRAAPREWMDDATATAAGIVEVILRHDSGRRDRRYCMPDTALHEADPDTSLLKRTPRAAFVEDYARRYGIGPARLRDCDVWRGRLIPFTYPPEENSP